MSNDLFEREGLLVVRTWPPVTEVVPELRLSGRLFWPSGQQPAVFRWQIHAEFEKQRLAGKRYRNDLFRELTFAEHTAVWFEDLRMHPWVDGIVPTAQKQPIQKHLLELRKLLIDYSPGKHLWYSVPSAEHSNNFADGLLVHVDAILSRGFPKEFKYRYQQPKLPASRVSAGGELFKRIKECLLNAKGKRVWPPVGYVDYAKSKGYTVNVT